MILQYVYKPTRGTEILAIKILITRIFVHPVGLYTYLKKYLHQPLQVVTMKYLLQIPQVLVV